MPALAVSFCIDKKFFQVNDLPVEMILPDMIVLYLSDVLVQFSIILGEFGVEIANAKQDSQEIDLMLRMRVRAFHGCVIILYVKNRENYNY